MSMTDPIADFLTRIRNATVARQRSVSAPSSKMKVAIADLLKREGFISGYGTVEDDKQGIINVDLRYDDQKQGIILGLKRISRPGRRVYVGRGQTPKVLNGLGVTILSTSRGVMTDRDARRMGVGGEVICQVW
ncbi:30S ribosomal protein S8 [Myxococcota bacterium]|nr:30S ribosomal protein S8 [Myxococcota bacterium]